VIPDLLIPILDDGVDLGDGRLQFVNSWYFADDPSRSFGSAAAQINVRNGDSRIQLNRTLDDATLIEGTMNPDGTFGGTISDPAPATGVVRSSSRFET
jgi:hypothetical protein